MFVLENDFVIDLVVSKISSFSENGVSCSDFEEFLSNLPITLIESLPESAKHTLGFYFNSYSYQIYSESFYNIYAFVSSFETKYSLF